MYMKANYFSLFTAYWNKQGLLVLSHINSPGEIIYFPLPSRKYLKRGREVFFCTARKVLSRTVADTQIQQRVSNLKPTLFYSNKCMHKCLLFQPQGSQEWDQLWLHATPSTRAEQAPGFCLALHSPSSSNTGRKHRGNSPFSYRQRRAEPPKLEKWGQKETGVCSPWSRNPCRVKEEISEDSECWQLKESRGTLLPCWAKLPWQKIEPGRWEEWGAHRGCNRQYKDTNPGPWIGWART